jgi:tellurite resistance protein TerC
MDQSLGSPLLWAGFTGFVLAMLALDLGVFHREAHEVRPREAAVWSAVWVSLAVLFALGVYAWRGPDPALQFFTGYLIEKALSVDNIFVFLVIFAAFRVPAPSQHRVLFLGILGALVMRAVFILLGAALLERFHWMMYVFGAVLVVTGVRMFRAGEEHVDPQANPVYRLVRRWIPVVPEYHGTRFTIVRQGRRFATPLLLVLVVVETTDLVFAVDSIPAIFAVTRDPFIVFTSNVFAILGLRAMFFLVAGVMDRFKYLKTGLALVLAFVGVKMIASDLYPIPVPVSLAVIALLIGGAVAISLVVTRRPPAPEPREVDVPIR